MNFWQYWQQETDRCAGQYRVVALAVGVGQFEIRRGQICRTFPGTCHSPPAYRGATGSEVRHLDRLVAQDCVDIFRVDLGQQRVLDGVLLWQARGRGAR